MGDNDKSVLDNVFEVLESIRNEYIQKDATAAFEGINTGNYGIMAMAIGRAIERIKDEVGCRETMHELEK